MDKLLGEKKEVVQTKEPARNSSSQKVTWNSFLDQFMEPWSLELAKKNKTNWKL